jgi:DNA polymerase I-like protein with 3'-5' exonuclease and polymerase domains
MRQMREEAERQAVNHKIQGGAAYLVKKAMGRWWRVGRPWLHKETGKWVELVLQLHDELLTEHDEGVDERLVGEVVKDCFTYWQPEFGVELVAGWNTGRSWGELK